MLGGRLVHHEAHAPDPRTSFVLSILTCASSILLLSHLLLLPLLLILLLLSCTDLLLLRILLHDGLIRAGLAPHKHSAIVHAIGDQSNWIFTIDVVLI